MKTDHQELAEHLAKIRILISECDAALARHVVEKPPDLLEYRGRLDRLESETASALDRFDAGLPTGDPGLMGMLVELHEREGEVIGIRSLRRSAG
jgi:hypothetical protein